MKTKKILAVLLATVMVLQTGIMTLLATPTYSGNDVDLYSITDLIITSDPAGNAKHITNFNNRREYINALSLKAKKLMEIANTQEALAISPPASKIEVGGLNDVSQRIMNLMIPIPAGTAKPLAATKLDFGNPLLKGRYFANYTGPLGPLQNAQTTTFWNTVSSNFNSIIASATTTNSTEFGIITPVTLLSSTNEISVIEFCEFIISIDTIITFFSGKLAEAGPTLDAFTAVNPTDGVIGNGSNGANPSLPRLTQYWYSVLYSANVGIDDIVLNALADALEKASNSVDEVTEDLFGTIVPADVATAILGAQTKIDALPAGSKKDSLQSSLNAQIAILNGANNTFDSNKGFETNWDNFKAYETAFENVKTIATDAASALIESEITEFYNGITANLDNLYDKMKTLGLHLPPESTEFPTAYAFCADVKDKLAIIKAFTDKYDPADPIDAYAKYLLAKPVYLAVDPNYYTDAEAEIKGIEDEANRLKGEGYKNLLEQVNDYMVGALEFLELLNQLNLTSSLPPEFAALMPTVTDLEKGQKLLSDLVDAIDVLDTALTAQNVGKAVKLEAALNSKPEVFVVFKLLESPEIMKLADLAIEVLKLKNKILELDDPTKITSATEASNYLEELSKIYDNINTEVIKIDRQDLLDALTELGDPDSEATLTDIMTTLQGQKDPLVDAASTAVDAVIDKLVTIGLFDSAVAAELKSAAKIVLGQEFDLAMADSSTAPDMDRVHKVSIAINDELKALAGMTYVKFVPNPSTFTNNNPINVYVKPDENAYAITTTNEFISKIEAQLGTATISSLDQFYPFKLGTVFDFDFINPADTSWIIIDSATLDTGIILSPQTGVTFPLERIPSDGTKTHREIKIKVTLKSTFADILNGRTIEVFKTDDDIITVNIPLKPSTSPLPSYNITFNSNGGTSVASQTIVSGGTVTQPAPPTRSGYTFLGWYSNSVLTNAYNFNSKVTGNITLYADWRTNTSTPVTPPTGNSNNSSSGSASGTVANSRSVSSTTTINATGIPAASFDFPWEVHTDKDKNIHPSVTPTRDVVAQLIFEAFGKGKPVSLSGDITYDKAILFVNQKKIMIGDPNGNFAPDRLIKRGEFAKIICNALGVEVEGSCSDIYSDMEGHWSDSYVATATKLGLIDGYPNEVFMPENTITLAEITKIIAVAKGYTAKTLTEYFKANPEIELPVFSDIQKDHWAYYYLVYATFGFELQ